MRKVLRLMHFMQNHPLVQKRRWHAWARFFKWQLSSYMQPYPVLYPFIEKTFLLVSKGMTGATGNIYTGLHEFNEMAFLLHFLRPDDLFVDVGSNVGSYTVLAAGVIHARCISIEPVPTTFKHLSNNIYMNGLEKKVRPYNMAVGSRRDVLHFTQDLDTVNHVLAQGERNENTIEVPVEPLTYFVGEEIPILMKIDVEGFEQEVIKGGYSILENPFMQALIIELNGSGNRYGFDEASIHKQLNALSFRPFHYNPFTRELTSQSQPGLYNTIYIKNVEQAKIRIHSARKISVLGCEV